ncbi:hypothetical protein CGCSCA5_v012587 [Colletotrichum siamense]|nr:hypothetical protein CGCSCA5_v012587 [Colletotrichum siamense]
MYLPCAEHLVRGCALPSLPCLAWPSLHRRGKEHLRPASLRPSSCDPSLPCLALPHLRAYLALLSVHVHIVLVTTCTYLRQGRVRYRELNITARCACVAPSICATQHLLSSPSLPPSPALSVIFIVPPTEPLLLLDRKEAERQQKASPAGGSVEGNLIHPLTYSKYGNPTVTLTQHVTPISPPNTRYYDPNQPFPAPIFFFFVQSRYTSISRKRTSVLATRQKKEALVSQSFPNQPETRTISVLQPRQPLLCEYPVLFSCRARLYELISCSNLPPSSTLSQLASSAELSSWSSPDS